MSADGLLIWASAVLVPAFFILFFRLTLPPKLASCLYNPMWASLSIIAIGFIDFGVVQLALQQNGSVPLDSWISITSKSDLMRGFEVYLLFSICWLISLSVGASIRGGLLTRNGGAAQIRKMSGGEDRRAEVIAFWGAAAISTLAFAVIFVANYRGMSIFEVTSQRRLIAEDDPLTVAVIPLFIPALAFLHCKIRVFSRQGVASLVVAVGLAVIALNRGSVFLILIIAALSYAKERPLKAKLIIPALVVLAVLFNTLRTIQRGWFYELHPESGASAQGGDIFDRLFLSSEIAFAEPLTILVARSDLRRSPTETLVGGLLVPVPRSLIAWKPIPPSTYFTSIVDPYRWGLAHSELVVTAFGDLWMGWGWLGGVPCLLIGFSLGVLSRRWLERFPHGASLAVVAYLIIVTVAMLRGDLFVAARNLWNLALAFIALRLVGRVVGIVPRARVGREEGTPSQDMLDGTGRSPRGNVIIRGALR